MLRVSQDMSVAGHECRRTCVAGLSVAGHASRNIGSYMLRVSQDMTSSQRVRVIPLKYRLRRVDLHDTPNIGCMTTTF